MQTAHVYQLHNGFLIHPNFQDENGTWLAFGPFMMLSCESSAVAVGQACLSALDEKPLSASAWHWPSVRKQMHAAAKVRSDKQLHTGAKLVFVNRDGQSLEVEPQANRGMTGPDRGYHFMPDEKTIKLAEPVSADSIGRAVLEALSSAI